MSELLKEGLYPLVKISWFTASLDQDPDPLDISPHAPHPAPDNVTKRLLGAELVHRRLFYHLGEKVHNDVGMDRFVASDLRKIFF